MKLKMSFYSGKTGSNFEFTRTVDIDSDNLSHEFACSLTPLLELAYKKPTDKKRDRLWLMVECTT